MNGTLVTIMVIFIVTFLGILSILIAIVGSLMSVRVFQRGKRDKQLHIERHYSVNHSKEILEFIRYLAMQVSILRHREFMDKIQLEKVNRSQIQELIKEVAIEVNEAINRENFSLSETILTEDFYANYLISTISNTVKKLIEDGIEEYDQ